MPDLDEVVVVDRLKINTSSDPSGNKLRNKINKIDHNEPDEPSLAFFTTVREIWLSAPIGYFLWLEGSWESLYIGGEKPEWLKDGDRVKITIQKDDSECQV